MASRAPEPSHPNKRPGRLGADLVEQLLDDEHGGETLASRLARLGYDLSPDRRHVVVALGPSRDGRQTDDCQHAARDLCWAAQRDGGAVLTVGYREQIMAFCSFPAALPDRRVRAWLQEALSAADGRCTAGVSRVVRDVQGSDRVGQCAGAGACRPHRGAATAPLLHEELGLYRRCRPAPPDD